MNHVIFRPAGSRFYPLSLGDSSQFFQGKLFPAFSIYPIVSQGSYHPVLFAIRKQDPVVGRDGGHFFPVILHATDLTDTRIMQILDSNDYL